MAVMFCGFLATFGMAATQANGAGPFRPAGTSPRFQGQTSSPNVISRTSLEAEMQFRSSDVKQEAEVKFSQLTKGDVTTTTLSAEVTVILPKGSAPLDATMLDAIIGGFGTTCSFSNDPSIRQVVRGTETLQVVTFRGSTAQMNIDPMLDKGLECGVIPMNIVAGEPATVEFTGFFGPVPLSGVFTFNK